MDNRSVTLSLTNPTKDTMPHNKQAVGTNFDIQKMLSARDKTFEAVNRIADKITVGMVGGGCACDGDGCAAANGYGSNLASSLGALWREHAKKV